MGWQDGREAIGVSWSLGSTSSTFSQAEKSDILVDFFIAKKVGSLDIPTANWFAMETDMSNTMHPIPTPEAEPGAGQTPYALAKPSAETQTPAQAVMGLERAGDEVERALLREYRRSIATDDAGLSAFGATGYIRASAALGSSKQAAVSNPPTPVVVSVHGTIFFGLSHQFSAGRISPHLGLAGCNVVLERARELLFCPDDDYALSLTTLASGGPLPGSHVSAEVAAVHLTEISAACVCSDEAAGSWVGWPTDHKLPRARAGYQTSAVGPYLFR